MLQEQRATFKSYVTVLFCFKAALLYAFEIKEITAIGEEINPTVMCFTLGQSKLK